MLPLVLAGVVCVQSQFTTQSNCRSSGGGSYVVKPRVFVPGYYIQGKDDAGRKINLTCTPSVFTQETRCQ